MQTQDQSPQARYEHKLHEKESALAKTEKADLLIANTRLGVFLLAFALLVGSYGLDIISPLLLLIPLLIFLILIVQHERIFRQKKRQKREIDFFQKGLNRLLNRWHDDCPSLFPIETKNHPYLEDLDIFGKNSIFAYLDTTQTQIGKKALAQFLAGPAGREDIRRRQHGIAEMSTRLELRENLYVAGGDLLPGLKPEAMIRWGEAPEVFGDQGARGRAQAFAWILAIAALGSLVAWAYTPVGPLPFIALLGVQWGVGRFYRDKIEATTAFLARPQEDLNLLVRVLTLFEAERFESPLLVELHGALQREGAAASARIRQLERVGVWLDAARNQIFAPFAFILMWRLHFTLAVERWRRQNGHSIQTWLHALGELEALLALSTFDFEHPDYIYPTFVEKGAPLGAVDLGHPLIFDTECIRNSVELSEEKPILMVSGSNMSGKSTMLRTVGTNVILAMAGAPVRATKMELQPLNIGASIRVHDSLGSGKSRFYAEIEHLKRITELTASPPRTLFLLDEILHGTNSHDRQKGAMAILKSLHRNGACGLVTTHDLALAKTETEQSSPLRNVHFRDEVKDGQLFFDYHLYDGVVQRSNALELMRSIGFDV